MENQRRSIISGTIEDFIELKSHVFRPMQKSHFKEHFYRGYVVKFQREQQSDISRKIMSLTDFNVPKHPSQFVPIKYHPYEILKIQKIPKLSDNFEKGGFDSVLGGFEAVDSEEITGDQQIYITKIVDEITSVRGRELRPGMVPNEAEFLEVITFIKIFYYRILFLIFLIKRFLKKMMLEKNFF